MKRHLHWHFSYRVNGKQYIAKVHYERGNAVTARQCRADLTTGVGGKDIMSVWPIKLKRSR